MNYTLHELLNLVLRWTHVFAAILWIGSTYFFTWLDGRLSDPKEGGEVWMVHSGGFYAVKKEKSPLATQTLHWFKWEAAITWISGILLFVVVYYIGGVLVDGESPVSLGVAIGISLGSLVVAWLIYDMLWSSPLGSNEVVGTVISFVLLVAAAYTFSRIFSSRASYLQIGAIMGTLMAANVWERILPAQRRLVAAAREGTPLDPALGAEAKKRSKHNTYMVIPVTLIMISNHFPTLTYGSRYNWAVLGVVVLVGWVAARVIRGR
ncbi:MAG TPA: urate hydroxylase PuuD [Thermoanaerobaculia bacterium]|nr:urate hydroxylase PuuD [Thermoanaerobaculia bacterium]